MKNIDFRGATSVCVCSARTHTLQLCSLLMSALLHLPPAQPGAVKVILYYRLYWNSYYICTGEWQSCIKRHWGTYWWVDEIDLHSITADKAWKRENPLGLKGAWWHCSRKTGVFLQCTNTAQCCSTARACCSSTFVDVEQQLNQNKTVVFPVL